MADYPIPTGIPKVYSVNALSCSSTTVTAVAAPASGKTIVLTGGDLGSTALQQVNIVDANDSTVLTPLKVNTSSAMFDLGSGIKLTAANDSIGLLMVGSGTPTLVGFLLGVEI